MTSLSLLDRLGSSRIRSPISPMGQSRRRSPNEYDLDELEPRPDDTLFEYAPPEPRLRKTAQAAEMRQPSPSFQDRRASSSASPSRTKSKPLFAGPPPPIASSRLVMGSQRPRTSPSASASSTQHSQDQGLLAGSRLNLSRTIFDQRQRIQEFASHQDSIWRGLHRRERAIEREVQRLLDLQASGLAAGSSATSDKDFETASADGSSTFGTFYSTATSPSGMVNSLHVPTRATPEGNIIPVRQPAPKKPMGLRSARAGLRKAMAALSELKAEEDTYVDAALTRRRDSLAYLGKMTARRDRIYTELHTLEDDSQEPLGQELRELGSESDALSREIQELEERLVGMRNRRRWLREKMDDVENRREAGLSGYRAAGREIDLEIRALVQRPPITPLDLDALRQSGPADSEPEQESPGGVEFLRLRPERRTADMAKTWWEREVAMLKSRKAQILADREALDEGRKVWTEVTKTVTGFEERLWDMIKRELGRDGEDAASESSTIRTRLTEMDSVISELKQRQQTAEGKHWNLLICAIGAELEAFIEARALLSRTLDPLDDVTQSSPGDDDQAGGDAVGMDSAEPEHHDESDNEVPPDLLVSRVEDHEPGFQASPQQSVVLRRQDSENDPPPDLLAECGVGLG